MTLKTNIPLYLLLLGIVTFPIYLMPSGGMQISHLILILGAVITFMSYGFAKKVTLVSFLFVTFASWVVVRQSFYSIEIQEYNLMPAAYVIFNVIIVFYVSTIFRVYGGRAVKPVFYATLASILVAFLFIVANGISLKLGHGGNYTRPTGSFNNPNQLAYFALSAAGILILLWSVFKINTKTFLVGLGLSFLLVIISLSKAAIIAVGLYVLTMISTDGRYKYFGFLMIFAAIAFLLTADLSEYTFYYRLAHMAEESDTFFKRGYDLLLDIDAVRLLLGAGKGYDVAVSGHEFHSTFGNILLSYGIIGFLLAGLAFWQVFRRVWRAYSLRFAIGLFAPVMAYGLTHNGSRATIAWIFLTTVYAVLAPSVRTRLAHPITLHRGMIPTH